MLKYAHIGCPKAASKALQSEYFGAAECFYHLGSGVGRKHFAYINNDLCDAVECDLRVAKDFAYDHARVTRVFANCFAEAEKQGAVCTGISAEGLTVTMHHDIDITQKALRLQQVMGGDTKIILVIRNQMKLIPSMYREYVRCGCALTYHDFINAIFYNQFRSCLHDFDFAKLYELYSDLFGKENVLVLPHEYLFQSSADFLSRIDAFLEVDSGIRELPTRNVSFPDEMMEYIRRFNTTRVQNYTKTILEPVGHAKYAGYFKRVLKVPPPISVLDDEKHIGMAINRATKLSALEGYGKLSYNCNEHILNKIEDMYAQSNERLQQAVMFDLRELGYPFPANPPHGGTAYY